MLNYIQISHPACIRPLGWRQERNEILLDTEIMYCYMVTLTEIDHTLKKRYGSSVGSEIRLVFKQRPTYDILIKKLPNEGRRILARDKAGVRFDLDLGSDEFSIPLFKNNPSGQDRFKNGFNHRKNYIGHLSVWLVPMI